MPITRFKDKEEKEEYLKQLKENRNETIKLAQQEQVRANKLFNENIRKGNEQNTDGTISIGKLRKAYKDLPSYNSIEKSTNRIYENRKKEERKRKEEEYQEKVNQTRRNNAFNKMIEKSGRKIEENNTLPTSNNMLPTATYLNYRIGSQLEDNSDTLPYVNKNNIKNANPAELEANNIPIISDKDPRLVSQNKKPWEYNKKDYEYQTVLNQKAQQKQADMINKMAETNSLGAGLLNAGMNFTSGMASTAFGIDNAINTGGLWVAKGAENLGKLIGNKELEEKAKKLYDDRVSEGAYINSIGNAIPGGSQYIDNGIIRETGNAANVMGNQLMSFGLGTSAGISGSTVQALGTAGSSSQEVLNENPDNLMQATATGIIKAGVSKKIEDMFDASILTREMKKTSIQNQVTNWIEKSFKSDVGREIANKITGVAGENVEEFLENNIGYIIDKLINNKDLPSLEEWWNEQTGTAKTTTIASMFMQLLGFGGSSFKSKKIDADSGVQFWLNEAQKIIDNDGLATQLKNDNRKLNLLLYQLNDNNSLQNVANKQELIYNNLESESVVNENNRRTQQYDRRRVQELFELYERGQRNETTDYGELQENQGREKITESTLKRGIIDYASKYAKNNLTPIESNLKSIINNLGGDVVFYEYGNENYHQGLADGKTFYIDTLGDTKIENVFYHELTHFLRQNDNNIYISEIQPIVNKIASDYNYQEAIFNYANSLSEDFDIRDLNGNKQMRLAEEVVADQIASIYGDLNADYGLENDILQQLKISMDKVFSNTSTGSEIINNQFNSQGQRISDNNSLQDIANKQDMLYNSLESEGIINGQRREVQEDTGIFGQYGTSIFEKNMHETDKQYTRTGYENWEKPNSNNKLTNEREEIIDDQRGIYKNVGRMPSILQQDSKPQQVRKYTKQEYANWEQSIKPITYSKLSTEQKQLKNNIKRQYGKDIVFFDENETDYNGGASLTDNSKIYVNRQNVEQFGINRIAFHEVMESNIRHNLDLSNDIINPAIENIMNDSNFQEQKNKFWSNQDGNIPSDYMIAKDILCDRFAEIKCGESLDYENVLSQETNMTIDFAIENFENSLHYNRLETAHNQFISQGQRISDNNSLQDIANKQDMVYNNLESESELNGRRQDLGSNNELARIYENSLQEKQKQYTRTEYEQWEQSIKPITYSKLSTEQKQLRNNIKRQYGKDIVFFDGANNENGYSAGASYSDRNRINIDVRQAQEYGTDKVIYHEIMESNILHNIETKKDIIEPAIQKIIEDPNFEQQKNIFLEDQNQNMPKDYLIAKDLLCDRYAETKTGQKWDYENVLSQETNMTIDFAIENFENSLHSNRLETAHNQFVSQGKQITPSKLKTAQNGNMRQTDIELPMQSYQYEKSKNSKIDTLRKDASKYFSNSEQSRNYITTLEKIITDKDVAIRFDDNLKTHDGRVANGSYSDGVITINPNSTKTGEFIAIHELTHAIGTKDMLDMIDNYRKSNIDFNTAVQDILQNYKITEINEETLSDISAQLFGNQEFINNIAQKKPNIFKKIYSEIKYLWHQFRGYKNQNQFIDDLYYKWTEAYTGKKDINDTTKYHISENFSNEIDMSLKGEIPSNNQVKARDYTPKILVENGVQNLPMLLTQKHLRQIVYTQQEAINFGYKISEKDHYHGLGKETLLKAIDNLDTPKEIYKQSENNYLIITEISDKNNNKIIVPIQINGKGTYNNMIIDENQISSVYGHRNLKSYLDKNNYEKVYEKNRDTLNEGVISHDISNSINSISSTKSDVNTTKYSIQKSENNSSSWHQYLDKNFKTTGTRTNLQDILIQKADNNNSFTKANIETDIKDNILEKANNQITAPELIDTKQFIVNKRTKEKASFTEIKDTLAQRFVNKGHYIDKFSKETNNPEIKYKYDRTMNAFNEAQVCIGDNQVDMNGNVTGESLIKIFSEAENAKLEKEFDDYLLNKHNIARNPIGKGIFGDKVTAPHSTKIVEAYESKYPEFKKWGEKVSKYNDNNLKDLVNAKMITEETYNSLRELYKDYVPTFRDITESMQEFEDGRVGNSPLKKATKSDMQILSPKEAMAEQTIAIKKAIRINEVGKELYKTLGKDSTFLDSINFDTFAIETMNTDIVTKSTNGNNIFTIFNGEKMTQFKISDELYSAFSKDTLQNKINDSKVAKTLLTPVEKISKSQRELLTTYSIGFMLNNPIKDIQDAVFNSKYGLGSFAKNYTKALYNIATDGDWYQSYKNNGGGANTYFDYNKGIVNSKKNLLKKFVDNVKYVNEVFEQAPRLAEYISTIEHGGNINEALYNSAEITTNFKRGGDITKAFNKYGVNFLNASVQGLDKTYRNIAGKNGFKGYCNILAKATLYQIVPAILNHLLLRDDDDYEKLPEYAKDNYYLFKLNDNGDFLRIPKGRVSSVVGAIARRVTQTAQGNEVDWKSLVDTAKNQIAPNNPFSDNIFAPILQVANNKAWYGGDIVNSRLQKLSDAKQYDESTDKLSIWLGDKLNKSPKKINYLIDQYSGGIGDVILPRLTPQAENNILEDKFTVNSITKNKNVSKYYSMLEELEKPLNDGNATEEQKLKYKYFSSINNDLRDLYTEKREIQMSETLNDNDKKLKVREVQKKINDIVEERISGVNNLKTNGSTASISDEHYYNDGEKWKALSEEETDKNKNTPIEIYSDYKNKIKAETKRQKDNGTLTDTQSLKDKYKIKILRNSNYTNKEKQAIYENYILKSTDKKYDIIKKTFSDNGLNIDKYLGYKEQEFSSDRKDDGTVKGKPVSNSKKNKVFNYIDSIKGASYTQKLILYALDYKPSSNSDRDIVINFIENNWKGKERLEILKNFKGVTIYKDGTFDY